MDSSPTAVKTFKYNSAQQQIFSVIETPIQYKSFAHTNGLIDVSFSSYLKHEQSENPSNDVHCSMDDSEINVFDAQKYFSESNDPKESKGLAKSNLKHIPEPNDAASRLSSVSSVDGHGRNFRVRSFHATPTASSEASWNSQTGLLSNRPGSVAVSLRNVPADHAHKRSGSSTTKWLFCRKCPCAGKKSVQVEEGNSEHRIAKVTTEDNGNNRANSHLKSQSQRTNDGMEEKTISNMSQKSSATDDLSETHQKITIISSRFPSENHYVVSNNVFQQKLLVSSTSRPFNDSAGGFSFPILNSSTYSVKPESKALRPKPNTSSPLEDPARESLEIFQPPDNTNSIRKSVEDDMASDASSDLFELESFSTPTTSTYRTRDSLDEASTLNARRLAASNNTNVESYYGRRSSLDEPMTPTPEWYAPSEASIDWSVTTAEGFDKASMTNFSTTASELDDLTILRHMRSSMDQKNDHANGYGSSESGRKRIGNGLLSCRHEKAVSVGPRPVKFLQDGSPLPQISTSGHVSTAATSRPTKPNAPPSGRGHSARLSLAFAV